MLTLGNQQRKTEISDMIFEFLKIRGLKKKNELKPKYTHKYSKYFE